MAFLPPHNRRAPCKAAAHGVQQDEVAFLDAAILNRRRQREGDGGGGGVGMILNRHHDAFRRHV